jgi:choline dehydrogenase-like flavoprotein
VTKEAAFDYIIVGAGSAGCVLANRLSSEGASVLVLEAGGWDYNPLISIPLGLGKLYQYGLYDWGLITEPEPQLEGRTLPAARGKVVGGSHSINVMGFTRGNAADFDRWARSGAVGWSYSDVLPYFRRLENWEKGESEWRGGSGPLHVESARSPDPIFEGWLAAARACGHPYTPDFNGASQDGFGEMQFTIKNGKRHSTASAYLHPVRNRKNLSIRTHASVMRLLFSGTKAVGVEFEHGSQLQESRALKEIILCAGAYHTPTLLMRAGIGPASELHRHGISQRAELPVGRNLQDHVAAWFGWSRREPGFMHHMLRFDRLVFSMARAYLFGTGPGTILPGRIYGFVKTEPSLAAPNVEIMFRATSAAPHIWFPGIKAPFQDGMAFRPVLLNPRSRGEVTLRSADPKDPPRIFNNFLSAPEDLKALVAGARMGLEIMSNAAMDRFRGESTAPRAISSDADIEAWYRKTANVAHHPAGTCAIGAVVDSDLRVNGFEGLRVVDASAMPSLVAGHINACVIMMAERASDLILGHKLSTS